MPKRILVDLPISKSMQVRALLIEKISQGKCHASLQPSTEDAMLMKGLLNEIDQTQSELIHLDCNNAGTSFRFLTSYCAALEGKQFILSGCKRMKHRPIKPLVDALKTLGADIEYIENDDCPPLKIVGKNIKGGTVSIDAQMSSQYVSSLMIASTLFEEGIEITWKEKPTSYNYIALTSEMLTECGVDVSPANNGQGVKVRKNIWYDGEIDCGVDWSAAAFWYAVVALKKRHTVIMKNLTCNTPQPDFAAMAIFEKLGVVTRQLEDGVEITNKQLSAESNNSPLILDLSKTPDIVPPLVVACCAKGKQFQFSGINSLRLKECDRVAALTSELRKFGYILNDSIDDNLLSWNGTITNPTNQTVDTHSDHRIAMAMAVLTLKVKTLEINNINVVGKSYPKFWEHFAQIVSQEKITKNMASMILKQRQDEIINNFEIYDDWMEKYQYLIEMGNTLEPMDESKRTDQTLIKGCQSQVWLVCEEKDGVLYFSGDSDAVIVKGIVALLVNVLSGVSAEEIADKQLYFIDRIGLKEHLSPTRSNGLVAMLSQMKCYALAYKLKKSGQIL